jgi:hypothetical protein
MTTHRHQDSRSKWTTSVTDPDLSGLATRAELASLAARVAALEARPAAVALPFISRSCAVMAPTISYTNNAAEWEWIDRSFFAA